MYLSQGVAFSWSLNTSRDGGLIVDVPRDSYSERGMRSKVNSIITLILSNIGSSCGIFGAFLLYLATLIIYFFSSSAIRSTRRWTTAA